MACELCGKEGPLSFALVEGTKMSVCAGCGKFGKLINVPVSSLSKTQFQIMSAKTEPVETIIPNFAEKIRSAREKLNLTQAAFATKLNEKESIIHKLENSSFTPPITLARKLEKLLKLQLVILEEEVQDSSAHTKSGPLTIGDILNSKR